MDNRNWYTISADDRMLGRLATQSAKILMGKNRPDFNRHEDKGDFLIIIDADKVKVSGNKEKQKDYFIESKYPGNSRLISYERMKTNKPEYIIFHAVKGMLPKNRLGRRMLTRLKVYTGSEHPHEAQNPVQIGED